MRDDLTVKEAARILDRSEGRVRKLIRAGLLSAQTFGGIYIVSRASVMARKRKKIMVGRPKKKGAKR